MSGFLGNTPNSMSRAAVFSATSPNIPLRCGSSRARRVDRLVFRPPRFSSVIRIPAHHLLGLSTPKLALQESCVAAFAGRLPTILTIAGGPDPGHRLKCSFFSMAYSLVFSRLCSLCRTLHQRRARVYSKRGARTSSRKPGSFEGKIVEAHPSLARQSRCTRFALNLCLLCTLLH